MAVNRTGKKISVVSISLVGGAYHNGQYSAGWSEAKLDNGTTTYLGGEDLKGFDGAVRAAQEQGYDTTDYVAKLDKWVKTGSF